MSLWAMSLYLYHAFFNESKLQKLLQQTNNMSLCAWDRKKTRCVSVHCWYYSFFSKGSSPNFLYEVNLSELINFYSVWNYQKRRRFSDSFGGNRSSISLISLIRSKICRQSPTWKVKVHYDLSEYRIRLVCNSNSSTKTSSSSWVVFEILIFSLACHFILFTGFTAVKIRSWNFHVR